MNAPIRLLSLVVLVLTSASCNHRDSLFETPSAPPSAPLQRGVFSLAFQPGALYGPGTARGLVVLWSAAPAGGLEVSLASDDPGLLSLPSTVTVPAGSKSVQFPAMAQAVSADRDITATATSAVGRPVTVTVSLWPLLPTLFSFWSDPGDYLGGDGVRRLAPPFASFSAVCTGNLVQFRFEKSIYRWYASFQAPKGMPLRVGTYEGATRGPFKPDSDPGLNIWGDGRSCNAITGRFTVREADFTASGQVRQFWATFEQHCEGQPPALYGDVRVTNGPAPPYGGNCLR